MNIHKNNEIDDFFCLNVNSVSKERIYHTLNGCVVPRPIAFVTTLNKDKILNAAPFSWFNAVCTDPPIISIAVAKRDGQKRKDTSRNILGSEEFVVNMVSSSMAAVISKCAGDFDESVSEVELTGLKTLSSNKVQPPRIAVSPVHLECVLEKHLEIGHSKVDFILGRVVEMHLIKDALDEKNRIDVKYFDPLARLNGDIFASLDDNYFSIKRG